jgi:hypothetical protein
MGHQRYNLTAIMRKDVVQQLLTSLCMFLVRFPPVRLPKMVIFCEAVFNLEVREGSGDPCPAAPLIAGMDTKSFSQLLLNNRRDSMLDVNDRSEC